MDGIFSKNLIELKSSNKKKIKENVENFLKTNSDSTSFSDDYFFIYNQLRNPQSNFFSKPLLDEINYVNIKGGDFFGAFTNTEKKIDYFLKSNSANLNSKQQSGGISFGIPLLKEKIQVNKTASLALKRNIEDEFEKYLAFYPEELSNVVPEGFSLEAQINKNKNLGIVCNGFVEQNFSLNYDGNDNFNFNEFVASKKIDGYLNKKNKFDNEMLLEDEFNLPLSENENQFVNTTTSTSRNLAAKTKNSLGKFLSIPKTSTNSILNLISEKYKIFKGGDCNFHSKNEEILLINPYTIINYEMNLVESYHNIIYDLPFPVEADHLYTCIVFLIQGIPSKFFIFDLKKFSFTLSNKSFRLVGTTSNLIEQYVKEFIEFGNCVFIVRSITEFYLFRHENTSFLLKKFFEFLNEFLIKLNEKFINLKSRMLVKKNLHLAGLAIKIRKYAELLNTLYFILDLPRIVGLYREANDTSKNNINNNYRTVASKNENLNFNLINNFLEFFNLQSPLKSNYLLNSLFGFFYYFNVKNANYYLTKNLLINTLKSYMRYVYFIIFNNENIDHNENLFINKNNNEIFYSINSAKIPEFLSDFKTYILNTSILVNLINKHDLNYFMICNLKLVDLLQYLDNFDFENSFSNDSIADFIKLKEKFFEMKFEFIDNYEQYEKNFREGLRNEKKIKRIQNIQLIKMNLTRIQNNTNKIKQELEEKRAKYLAEIQNQIREKNKQLEEKMQKIKAQQLLQKQNDKETEELKNLIKSKLTKKYQNILEETKKYEKFISDKYSWKINRENLNPERRKIIKIIYDEKITYENIFLNERKKTSAFALSEYLTYFPLEYKSLLAKNNMKENIYNNLNNLNDSFIPLINRNDMIIQNKSFADNYHALNYFKYNDFNDYKNKNKILNLDEVNKSNLIEIALKEMDIEDFNVSNKKAKVNSILTEDLEAQNLNNLQDFSKGLNDYANGKSGFVISDENTKIINNPNHDNEIIVYEFIKANFVLSLIDKVVVEKKPENKENLVKANEGKALNNLYTIKKLLERKIITEIRAIKTKEILKDIKELSIADEIFEMVNTIESVINSGFEKTKSKKSKNELQSAANKPKNKQESNFIEIPIQVILQEFFFDLILNQYKVVNKCFKAMLSHRYELKSHFKICSEIFLHGSGDIIESFLEELIDYKTLTLQTNDPKCLNEILRKEITKKLKNNSQMVIEDSCLIDSFRFSYYKNFELRFAVGNLEYAFSLFYDVAAPVSFCFTKEINLLYDEVFKKLLKWKVFQSLHSKIFAVLKDFKRKKVNDALLMKIWIILHRSFNIVNSVINYIFVEIINKRITCFEKEFEKSEDMFKLNKKHFKFLDEISKIIFTNSSRERANSNNIGVSNNNSVIMGKQLDAVTVNPIIVLFEKLNSNIAKFYQKSVAYDFFDFDSLKEDEKFLKIVIKIEKYNNLIAEKIVEEEIIGEFYNLKFYIN